MPDNITNGAVVLKYYTALIITLTTQDLQNNI